MTTSDNPLRDVALMTALFELLIPESPDGTMPSAGSLGLGETVAASIEADRMLRDRISDGLRAISDAALTRSPQGFAGLAQPERLAVVQSVMDSHRMLMNGLARHLYPAYYQHPRVLEGLGEPARPPFPEGFSIEPTDEGLLDALHARRLSRRARQTH